MGRVWGKPLQWGILILDLASIYVGIETGMKMVLRVGMGTVKQSTAPPRCHPIHDLHLLRKNQNLKTQIENHKQLKLSFLRFFKTKQTIKIETFKRCFDTKCKHKIDLNNLKID